jgi:dipeptidyl aminopeptidase/acylaminoacyl peptidase
VIYFNRILIVVIGLSCLAATLVAAEAPKQRGWIPELSMKTDRLHRVVPSPNGKYALIERGQAIIDEQASEFTTQIFLAAADGSFPPRLITQIDRPSFRADWSPDGRWISFLSHREDGAQLYIMPTGGGQAIQLTWMNEGVQAYRWSPDSRAIAFTAREDLTREELNKRRRGDDPIVVGDDSFQRIALWLVMIGGYEPVRVTGRNYHVRGIGDFGNDAVDFDWSPEGDEITFAHSPRPDPEVTHRESRLSTLYIRTGEIRDWEPTYTHESLPRYSPDGRWIAFFHGDRDKAWAMTGYSALRSRDGRETRELARTKNEGPYFACSPLIGWSGNNLLICEPSGTRFSLVALPSDGSPPIQIDDGQTFFSSVTLNGNRLGLVIEALDAFPEAFITGINRFAPIPISYFNAWTREIPIAPTKKIKWTSVDGIEIEGLLTLPRNYKKGEPVPLLLIVHGGPMGFHREECIAAPNIYPIAAFADAGFAVLQPNPRGSCGYGKAFRHLIYQDWGGLDHLDLMAGIDLLVKQGVADPDRLGVMGWSYGGYMTMWIITQTHRFRAASAGAGVCDLVSFAGTHDLPSFLAGYFGGELWETRQLYVERSPLTHIHRVKTPCLIQHGSKDRRVPIGQSEQFHQALKRREIETQFVVYPRSGHGPREPRQLLDSMERNLDWFTTHIK